MELQEMSYFARGSSLRAKEHAPICIPQIIKDKRRAAAAGGSSEIRIVFCSKTRATYKPLQMKHQSLSCRHDCWSTFVTLDTAISLHTGNNLQRYGISDRDRQIERERAYGVKFAATICFHCYMQVNKSKNLESNDWRLKVFSKPEW
jgi:hypothetical protein